MDDSISLLRNYQGSSFGIVGRRDLSSSFDMGMIVDIVEDKNYFERASFVRSYTDFVVECRERMRIVSVVNDNQPM